MNFERLQGQRTKISPLKYFTSLMTKKIFLTPKWNFQCSILFSLPCPFSAHIQGKSAAIFSAFSCQVPEDISKVSPFTFSMNKPNFLSLSSFPCAPAPDHLDKVLCALKNPDLDTPLQTWSHVPGRVCEKIASLDLMAVVTTQGFLTGLA